MSSIPVKVTPGWRLNRPTTLRASSGRATIWLFRIVFPTVASAVLRAGTINLQTGAGSTGQIGTSSASPLNLEGATLSLHMGQGSTLAAAYVSNTGATAIGTFSSNAATAVLEVSSTGAITQGVALLGSTLVATTLNDAGAAITLTTGTNDFDTVSVRALNAAGNAYDTGAIQYTDDDGFDIGDPDAYDTGTLSTLALTAGGAITDTGAISAASATIVSDSGATLDAGHTIDSVTMISIPQGIQTKVPPFFAVRDPPLWCFSNDKRYTGKLARSFPRNPCGRGSRG